LILCDTHPKIGIRQMEIYSMKNSLKWLIGIFLITVLLSLACAGGFLIGNAANLDLDFLTSFQLPVPTSTDEKAPEAPVQPDREQLFKAFWQAWDLVHEEFVDQPVDDVALMRGAIQGMLDSLGEENTSYVDPELLKQFNAQITGEDYEGIGAWVDTSGEYLKIISPMVGSPAEKVGLRSGDLIIAIDGKDMTGIDGELVRQKVLGKAGTKVILTVRRPGTEEPIDFEVVRASIRSSNVMSRMLDEEIGYIRLLSFGDEKTITDFKSALQALLDENPKGIIFDLRNNGGGLLDSAVIIASQFIDHGVILIEQYGDGRKEEHTAQKGGIATEIPLVLLVNEGSASASEIVAGAIQDLKRGDLIGTITYGKGSVQIWTDLVDEQGAVRITVAKWLTPNGRTINKKGIIPDYQVEIADEQITAGEDPQLQKAIDLILSK
jgi:carboxyl-terminal processing protease